MTSHFTPEQDTAIARMLPHVPDLGWGRAASAAGADADLLFPDGPAEMVEAHADLADRRMVQDAAAAGLAGLRLHERVRAIVALRLRENRADRDAIRRGLGLLAIPSQAGRASRRLGRTVDAIWFAAGDQSSDFNWYSKRLILASVYGSTLLAWLGDTGPDDSATLAFLDRRLAGVARIGRFRGRLSGLLGRRPRAA